jgi:hypothetical protein
MLWSTISFWQQIVPIMQNKKAGKMKLMTYNNLHIGYLQ